MCCCRNYRIVVQDIDVSLFRIFLEYLYGKPLDYENYRQEELVELLAVADRYEVMVIVHLLFTLSLTHRQVQDNQFSARQLRVIICGCVRRCGLYLL